MGFSVSGAAAIIFLAVFVAFGAFYTAADNSFHELVDAQDESTDRALETANTGVAIGEATVDDDELTITANNTGSTALSLTSTSLLVDGGYESGWQDGSAVDGNDETELWLPGETLTITVSAESPERVTLVTDSGHSTAAEVTE